MWVRAQDGTWINMERVSALWLNGPSDQRMPMSEWAVVALLQDGEKLILARGPEEKAVFEYYERLTGALQARRLVAADFTHAV